MFLGLDESYAFGFWFGLIISLIVHWLAVYRANDLVGNNPGSGKVTWRVSFLALAKYLLYGLTLAVTVVTEWLSFFAAAGGLILPIFFLQIRTAVKSFNFGG